MAESSIARLNPIRRVSKPVMVHLQGYTYLLKKFEVSTMLRLGVMGQPAKPEFFEEKTR